MSVRDTSPDEIARVAEVLGAAWQLEPGDAVRVRTVHEVTTVLVEGLFPDASSENARLEPTMEAIVVGDEAAARCVRNARAYGDPVAVCGYRAGRLAALPAKALPAVSAAADRVQSTRPPPSAVQITVHRERVARVHTGTGATAWLGLRSGRVLWAYDPTLQGCAAGPWRKAYTWVGVIGLLVAGVSSPIALAIGLVVLTALFVTHRVVTYRRALPPDPG